MLPFQTNEYRAFINAPAPTLGSNLEYTHSKIYLPTVYPTFGRLLHLVGRLSSQFNERRGELIRKITQRANLRSFKGRHFARKRFDGNSNFAWVKHVMNLAAYVNRSYCPPPLERSVSIEFHRIKHHPEALPVPDKLRIMSNDLERCYRCILLNAQCDITNGSCVRCDEAEQAYVFDNNRLSAMHDPNPVVLLPCKKQSDLTKGFETAFKCALQIGPSQWVLQEGDLKFVLTVDYSDFEQDVMYEHTFQDVTYFQKDKLETCSRLKFLDQFETIHSRWGGLYETLTEVSLQMAAKYQKWLVRSYGNIELNEDQSLNDDLLWVIHDALRCLVLLRNVETIGGYLPFSEHLDDTWSESETIVTSSLDSRLGGWCAQPTIHVAKQTQAAQSSLHTPPQDVRPSATLANLLPATLNAAQSLLLLGRPKDWPTIFYALYITYHVQKDLANCKSFTTAFHGAERATKKAFRSLCELYLHCCGPDLQPLSRSFNEEWYKLVLGAESPREYLEHYSFHYDRFMENDDPESDANGDLEDFIDILDRYAYGFID